MTSGGKRKTDVQINEFSYTVDNVTERDAIADVALKEIAMLRGGN